MECSEGLAPSDAGFTTQGLGGFGIEHALCPRCDLL